MEGAQSLMKSLEKQKMCPNCEGRIPLEVEICPYCAHELTVSAAKLHHPLFQPQTLEDSLASLYKPPYQEKRSIPIEEPPMSKQSTPTQKNVEASLYGAPIPEERMEQPVEAKSSLMPTLLLLLGSQLLLLGLLLLVFSSNGVLRLEWDASNWFFYCLSALPLLYFGWKKLQEIE